MPERRPPPRTSPLPRSRLRQPVRALLARDADLTAASAVSDEITQLRPGSRWEDGASAAPIAL